MRLSIAAAGAHQPKRWLIFCYRHLCRNMSAANRETARGVTADQLRPIGNKL